MYAFNDPKGSSMSMMTGEPPGEPIENVPTFTGLAFNIPVLKQSGETCNSNSIGYKAGPICVFALMTSRFIICI